MLKHCDKSLYAQLTWIEINALVELNGALSIPLPFSLYPSPFLSLYPPFSLSRDK